MFDWCMIDELIGWLVYDWWIDWCM